MNCPICKNELEIKQKKVGETAAGEIIYNEFAICHNCKKQWNLDKQRAKKQASAENEKAEKTEKAEGTVEHPVKKRKKRPVSPEDATKRVVRKAPSDVSSESEEERPRKVKKKRLVSQSDVSKSDVSEKAGTSETSVKQTSDAPRPKKKRPVNPDGTPVHRKPTSEHHEENRPVRTASADSEHPHKVKKKRPVPSVAEDYSNDFVDFDRDDNLEEISLPKENSSYSNIPPKHIREAREKEMRENYQNMLDEDDEEEGGAPIALILIIIIILLAVAAFCGYWFILR